jgi:hypothetical protein
MCRERRLYDVERLIGEGKPLQLAPEAILKGTRPKTALQIALESGQHSLASLLPRSGYRLELERYAPLDMVLQDRRWDLVDLLVEWGADLRSADVYTVLNTYNVELYERLWAVGYDLTEGIARISTLRRRGRPVRGPHPHDIRCHTRTRTAPGADGTAWERWLCCWPSPPGRHVHEEDGACLRSAGRSRYRGRGPNP